MRLPVWLSLVIAGVVILWGCYRLWLAVGGPTDEQRAKVRRGLLAMPRRQHGLVGVLFLLAGGALVATSFGFNPFRDDPPAEIAPAAGSPKGNSAGSGAGSAIPVVP